MVFLPTSYGIYPIYHPSSTNLNHALESMLHQLTSIEDHAFVVTELWEELKLTFGTRREIQ